MKCSFGSLCVLLTCLSSVSYADFYQQYYNGGNQVRNGDSDAFNRNVTQPQYGEVPETLAASPLPEVPALSGTGASRISDQEIAKKMAFFDLVIIVNKATSAQTIRVYKKTISTDANGVQQAYVTPLWKEISHPVSTGAEEYGCNVEKDPATRAVTGVRSIYKQTPTGYYTVDYLDIDHFSGVYDDSWMPYAVFVRDEGNLVRGIATHKAPPGTDVLIGNRESHACMRLHLADAQEIFRQVLATGGPINRSDAKMHAKCDPAIAGVCRHLVDPQNPQGDVKKAELEYQTFLDSVPTSPYATMPSIPMVIRATGEIPMVPNPNGSGQIPKQSRFGYKTLYIIEDVETGTPRNYIVRAKEKGPTDGRTTFTKQASWDGKSFEYVFTRPVNHQPLACAAPQAQYQQQQQYYQQQQGGLGGFFQNFFGGPRR